MGQFKALSAVNEALGQHAKNRTPEELENIKRMITGATPWLQRQEVARLDTGFDAIDRALISSTGRLAFVVNRTDVISEDWSLRTFQVYMFDGLVPTLVKEFGAKDCQISFPKGSNELTIIHDGLHQGEKGTWIHWGDECAFTRASAVQNARFSHRERQVADGGPSLHERYAYFTAEMPGRKEVHVMLLSTKGRESWELKKRFEPTGKERDVQLWGVENDVPILVRAYGESYPLLYCVGDWSGLKSETKGFPFHSQGRFCLLQYAEGRVLLVGPDMEARIVGDRKDQFGIFDGCLYRVQTQLPGTQQVTHTESGASWLVELKNIERIVSFGQDIIFAYGEVHVPGPENWTRQQRALVNLHTGERIELKGNLETGPCGGPIIVSPDEKSFLWPKDVELLKSEDWVKAHWMPTHGNRFQNMVAVNNNCLMAWHHIGQGQIAVYQWFPQS